MTETLNFREFYQKSLIQISPNDKNAIQVEEPNNSSINSYTHWLIALEGNELTLKTIQWRVVIFLTNVNGNINYNLPFFQSTFLPTFNEAFELSNQAVRLAKQDQLITLKK